VAALHDALHRHGRRPVAAPAKDDKRFKDEEWQEHFLFDFMKQSYLIAARHIHDTVSSVDGLDDQSQKKVNFYTRQYIDALSPSNFALTNPEVFRETVKSHGQNLIKGLNNLLRDVEEGDGNLRVKMTDTTAFELGKNVATTPGKVVFQNDMMQLLQYTPSTPDVSKRPLLIVPPWINKFYILDLREKNSYIKWCVDQGHTVFVISWVNRTSAWPRRASTPTCSKAPWPPSTPSSNRPAPRKSTPPATAWAAPCSPPRWPTWPPRRTSGSPPAPSSPP
jgi:polyhydroxyalkanoate synthase